MTRYVARHRLDATLVLEVEAKTPERARLDAANTWHVPQALVEVAEIAPVPT